MERWHLSCLQKLQQQLGGSDTLKNHQEIQWTCFTYIILEPLDGAFPVVIGKIWSLGLLLEAK